MFNNILIKDGIKGFYKGLIPSLLREVPYSGLFLVFYSRILDNSILKK